MWRKYDRKTFYKLIFGLKMYKFLLYLRFILVPSRLTLEQLIFVFVGWIPGCLGFVLRRFIWSFFCRHIGKNVKIFPDVRLLGTKNICLADHSVLWFGTTLVAFNGELIIGEKTTITGSYINASEGRITIGSHCALAPGVIIRSANHNFSNPGQYIIEQGHSSEPVCLEDDIWVAANATILPGAIIGKGSVIAAGAVVTRGVIAPNSIIAGVPGKVIKTR